MVFYARSVTQSLLCTIRWTGGALASLHEAFNGSIEYEPIGDQDGLKQRNKALAGLNKYISTAEDKSLEAVLVCCTLFTFLECLHGDHNAAGQHLQGGLKISSS